MIHLFMHYRIALYLWHNYIAIHAGNSPFGCHSGNWGPPQSPKCYLNGWYG